MARPPPNPNQQPTTQLPPTLPSTTNLALGMLNTMFTLTVLSSVTLQALHASFATPARSFNAQTAFQFLNHGRRKQKKAYKRYIAKLRDEATDDANDLLIARQAGMPYSEKSSSGSRAQAKTRFRARISYCGTPFCKFESYFDSVFSLWLKS